MLAYLQLTSSLVGVDDFSDWPHDIQALPRLGPDLSIRMDDVEALQPDLVLASLSVPGMEKNIDELKKRGIPHVVYNPNSLADIRANLLDLGMRTSRTEEAKKIVQTFDQIIQTYQQYADQVQPLRLYWEWWPKPVFTPGGKNWLTEISMLAGGINLFHDVDLASVQTDWEDVHKREPDHICLAWVGVSKDKIKPELLYKRPNWSSMRALVENRIHVLEEALYCRPSPRLLLGLTKLASLLHPTVYPQYDGIDPLLR